MYLIFDTETTGLPVDDNAPLTDFDNWPRMVQIAWQLHDKEGRLVSNRDYVIRPEGYEIPYSATQIHGITTQMAEELGHDLRSVLEEFSQVVQSARLGAGHNLKFDYTIVGAEFLRKGMKNVLEDLPFADTMEAGRDFCKIPTRRPGVYKVPRLEELYEQLFGQGFDQAHNAAADVNATAQAFMEMCRLGVFTAEDLKIKPEELDHFQGINPQPFSAFDIEIREQIQNIKRKKLVDPSLVSGIDLGSYFPFHQHTVYSTLQATTKINDIVDFAFKNEYPAVGIADFGNLMGAFKFISEVEKRNKDLNPELKNYLKKYKKEIAEGLEIPEPMPEKKDRDDMLPILGCEFWFSDRPRQNRFTKDDPDRRSTVLLFALNHNGYKNLSKLSSLGFIHGLYNGMPRIGIEDIRQYQEDLVMLTGGAQSHVPYHILEFGEKRGAEALQMWKEIFGDRLYIQLQNHQTEQDDYLNSVMETFAQKFNIKTLVQNEVYYAAQEDSHIYEIANCVKDGHTMSTPTGNGFSRRKVLPSTYYYMHTREEVKAAFHSFTDSIQNYEEFLNRFEPYSLKRDILLPKFDIPEEFKDPQDEKDGGKRGENAYLRHLTYQGARERYVEITPELTERLDFELSVIANTGYPGYFLIVQDFCNEARKMGVCVGPGRGSAAGSAVAYCTGITNVDPIEYDLLFERFLNPERISMPDIDIDFDDEGREKIIQWVIDKYGQNQVAQIITYTILGGKSALRDTAKALDKTVSESIQFTKLVPDHPPGLNIDKVLKWDISKFKSEDVAKVQDLRQIMQSKEDERHEIAYAASRIEGCIRGTGMHACGIIITPEDITNIVPISTSSKDPNVLVSQFDNSVAEDAGLLKMDFLGLKTLTIIRDAIQLIEKRHGTRINPDDIPLDDIKTYQLFQRGETIGIFQYESPGMQKYMRELKPSVFADLIAMNALYRPGPIKYIPNFINRKHGIEPIVYDLPECEEYLKETYGITVYQEQVMLLSQKLANFTKGEADNLRKAMGKKQKDVLDKMLPKFLEGGKANHLDENVLKKIWTDWEAFASYAFNKSHSTCYALIAYRTAYLKANYPAEFMASVLGHNLGKTNQLSMLLNHCKKIGIEILLPDVNRSDYKFSVPEDGKIAFGLGAIKGIGSGLSDAIEEERKKSGTFTDIYDFVERLPLSVLTKKILEKLVLAGALDSISPYHRAQYFADDKSGKPFLESLIRYAQQYRDSIQDTAFSLFADMEEEVQINKPRPAECPEWSALNRLTQEKKETSLYLSGHPLDEFLIEYRFLADKWDEEIFAEINEEENIEIEIETIENDADIEEIEQEKPLFSREIERKGKMGFIFISEMDTYQNTHLETIKLKTKEIKDWRQNRQIRDSIPEVILAGLVTEVSEYYEESPEGYGKVLKNVNITLEDFSGSARIRMKAPLFTKNQQLVQTNAFLWLKIGFSVSKDLDRCFIEAKEVGDMKQLISQYSEAIVLSPEGELDVQFVEAIQQVCQRFKGQKKLILELADPSGRPMQLPSIRHGLEISKELISNVQKWNKMNMKVI